MPVVQKPEKIQHLGRRSLKVNFELYADPGVGKTLFLGSSVLASSKDWISKPPIPALLLNADGPDGPESIRAMLPKSHWPDIWDVEGPDDLDDAFTYLRRFRRLPLARQPYRWVWLDSGTLYQELGMDEIMRKLVQAHPQRDPDIPDVPQYLKNQNHFSAWLRHMKALPFNFGLTAHTMRTEDADGEVTYKPAIHGGKGNLSDKVCAYMSIVGRLYIGRVKTKGGDEREARILQTVRRDKWYGKDRFNALGGVMVDPSIPKVLEAINNGSRRNG
jgi:hypothetical protein